jgi:hypothetical protein
MAIQSICVGCGKTLSVADEHAGRRARCPACGHVYTVAGTVAQPNPSGLQMEIDGGYQHSDEHASDVAATAGAPDSQYWMRTATGDVYGPTNRETLSRWFREGRVGTGYQIRQGPSGPWQDAAFFAHEIPIQNVSQPESAAVTTSVNPYAVATDAMQVGTSGGSLHHYSKPDRGAIVLVMGILSYVICGIFAVVAVVMGRTALNDINAGLANPSDKALVQIGFWMGVINLALHLLGFAILIAFIVIVAITS